MRKLSILFLTVFVSIIIAGIYGIIHDQITYSISPEYFTRFKYQQFGLQPDWLGGHRPTVAVIGFLATWWVGLIVGVVLGVTGLIFSNYKTMRRALQKAIVLTFSVAVAAGVVGFLYVKLYLAKAGVSWWLPDKLVDTESFIIVGSIHNFGYAGGLLGLVVGVVYLIRKNKSERRWLASCHNAD